MKSLPIILTLPILWLAYYIVVVVFTLDGAMQELFGHRRGGHSHGKLHRVLWQYHTGLHVNPRRSYGDERHLKRTAGSSSRATPEGAIVYWTRMHRPQRAIRNNLIAIGFLTLCWSLVVAPKIAVQVLTVIVILSVFGLLALLVYKLRRHAAARPKTVYTPDLSKAGVGPRVVYAQAGTITTEKPKLDGGVPEQVMAMLLAEPISVSFAEAKTRLSVGADRGILTLPDSFAALPRQRETVQEIVSANTKGNVAFTWATNQMPRTVSWVPVVTNLPREVLFRNYLSQLEALPRGDFGVGVEATGSMYVTSHRGDFPWHLRSAGPGTGKSTGFFVKAAQICHQDPEADLYCVDTKQISFENLHGIPGVRIYDDPESRMADFWSVFFIVEGIMRDRYTAVRKREARPEDFNDLWLLVDEGNDLAGQLKLFYQEHVKERNDPAQPTIWTNAIAPIINLGRQVGIRGEWMFQNMTDRVLGGVSLRDAFPIIGMAGYKKNQWSRIVGTSPVPELKTGPGRICMVKGPEQKWVQGFYDDPDYLRQYALANRQGRTD